MSHKDQITKLLIASFLVVSILVLAYFVFVTRKDPSSGISLRAEIDQSIAVLPFVNLSNDPEQEYFSDGLSEGIIDKLSQTKGLKVTARTSSFKFKGQAVNLQEINNKLGARRLLDDSYERRADRIRVQVQLINVEDNLLLWSEVYDEKVDNILILQDKICRTIAEKLHVIFDVNESLVPTRRLPTAMEYELFLQGRSQWNVRTPPALRNGIEFFQQAISSNPTYAEAYAGLADCYTALGYASYLAPRDAFPKAIEAAKKALELDSTLAAPHASLGYCRFYYDWDWAEAEQEFRRALALNPNYELAYDWYGTYLTAMQRYDEAITIFRKAASLDPLSVPIQTNIGFSYYYGSKYDSALKELQTSVHMNPAFNLSRLWLSRTYQAMKMYPEAILEGTTSLEIVPEWPVALAQIGNVYGLAGKRMEAQKILDNMKSLASKKFVTSYGLALVYVGLNENEEAFSMLNKAYEERSNWLVWLKTDPRLSSLRSDKRYAELVNKVGLPN